MFKSTDGGAVWASAQPGIGRATAYVVVKTASPPVLYATVDSRVWSTVDHGDTWTEVRSLRGRSTAIVAVAPDRLIARTTRGDRMNEGSSDAWVPVPADWRNRVSGTSGSRTIYKWDGELDSSERHLLRSTDAGRRWTALAVPQRVDSLMINPHDDSDIYADTMFNGFHHSRDGGRSWTRILPEIDSIVAHLTVLFDHDDRNVAYAMVGSLYVESDEGDIYKTADGGDTWTRIVLDDSRNVPVHFLVMTPTSPSTLFAGAWDPDDRNVYQVLKSTDRGAT